jgi:hypothetical protein
MFSIIPMTPLSESIWCSFRRIPSAAEASFVSECCLFSLATLEVTCIPATENFALTECENSASWRWAIISPDGLTLDDGREPSCAQAKRIAEAELRLVPV